MTLTFASILTSADIDPTRSLVIRHAYVREHDDGTAPIHADSTDDEMLAYTRVQSSNPRIFPANPPPTWVVFLPEGGDRARLWSVLTNHGEIASSASRRTFELTPNDRLADLKDRLVLGWRSPRTWRINATTAADYPVVEISDAEPVPFPGFDKLVLNYSQLQAVMREHRYAAWRTALASVIGIYLITDTRDGRHYVGKADGAENIRQRWSTYASNGHGGNVRLRDLDPSTFRLCLLRVFDPGTPRHVIDGAESHYKYGLDSVRHGLNGS